MSDEGPPERVLTLPAACKVETGRALAVALGLEDCAGGVDFAVNTTTSTALSELETTESTAPVPTAIGGQVTWGFGDDRVSVDLDGTQNGSSLTAAATSPTRAARTMSVAPLPDNSRCRRSRSLRMAAASCPACCSPSPASRASSSCSGSSSRPTERRPGPFPISSCRWSEGAPSPTRTSKATPWC